MARLLEAQFAGRYLMSSVLITSTMKSDPGVPLTRASSRGVPVSASAALPEGGSAEGALGACATRSAERAGAIAVAAPAATTPVRNLRRSAFGPVCLFAIVSSSCSSPGGDFNPGLLCLRSMALKLLLVWLINALALLALPYIVPSVQVDSFYTALIAALLLGFVNTLIRPLIVLLTLPVTVLTLGLFIFVINGLLFWFVASFVKGFSVAGFWSAFFGAIVYALISWAASGLVFGPPRIVVVRHEEHR